MRVSITAYRYLLQSLLVGLVAISQGVHGWSPPTPQQQPRVVSRRAALLKGLVVASSGLASAAVFSPQQPAMAAAVPSPEEIQRLQKGHSRLTYLLLNWDKLTTFCGNKSTAETSTVPKQVIPTEDGRGGGNTCERTPLVIQEYMGAKSINDPLFKADKFMLRAVPLANDQDAYLDAVERYREKADMVSLMAYTSSWTGANQGFGVEDSLESTKQDVMVLEKTLKEILGYLDLKILPPSK
jgi:hypothetical protein